MLKSDALGKFGWYLGIDAMGLTLTLTLGKFGWYLGIDAMGNLTGRMPITDSG